MSVALFSISSSLHSEKSRPAAEEPFIRSIEEAYGQTFEFPEDFSSFGTHDRDIIYVRTGGTEGIFKSLAPAGFITLLTSGESNSLAASMEILSFLRQHGQKGEILHGTPQMIAEEISHPDRSEVAEGSFVQPMPVADLGGIRLGVIGEPSDWLISSGVDYAKARERFNVEIVNIPMPSLVREIMKHDVDLSSFEGSEAIYDALKKIVSDNALGGLTLRCFDLLDSVHNTGCLALARLNSEGMPSSCEGDIPALISMAYLHKTSGCPGFQCNLSRIDGDDLLLAHCTVPLQMTRSYKYMTHFESGIGTAIKGEIPEGRVEIFKIAPDLEHCVRIPGTILRNESKPNLCRTQIVVHSHGAASYFLREPLANHHIVSLLKG